MGAALSAFVRKKDLARAENLENKIPRVLNTIDLIFLGIGGTLGAGVYVVTADIAKHVAGPGVVLSFLIAAFASLLCALCYAEFGARVPKAGSAYTYTYVTIGELAAFVIGWNLLLEYLIGAAAVARAWTSYIDSLADNAVSNALMTYVVRWHTPGLSSYPDFFSFAVCLLVAFFLLIGARVSASLNSLMTLLNLAVIFFIMLIGIMLFKPSNWSTFLPYGFSGVFKGSATAFFAFVGFDVIATSAEEAKHPATMLPQAILATLGVCLAAYLSLAGTLTLISSYKDLEENAAIPNAFHDRGLGWAKYVIASGAIAGLTSSLMGSMFAVPRLLYSMGDDGLLFSAFARINSVTKTPIFSSIFTGLVTGWLAMYFDLSTLVEMMSIGTLQAYTMVAACVLLLRYQVEPVGMIQNPDRSFNSLSQETATNEKEKIRISPTERSSKLVAIATFVILIVCFALSALFIYGGDKLIRGYFWAITAFFTLLGAFVVAVTVIVLQPQNKHVIPFKAPLVPVLPVLTIFLNSCLMMELSPITWARFGLWIFLGESK